MRASFSLARRNLHLQTPGAGRSARPWFMRFVATCLLLVLGILPSVKAAELTLKARVLLEFGKLVPPQLVEPAVSLAGDLYALGFREDEAGPFLVTVQRDYLYDAAHQLSLDVYLPQFAPPPLPTILLIHGGGWKYFNKSAVSGYARYLVSHGFAAVAVDYRLSTEAKWPAQLDDLQHALSWITSQGLKLGIDPLRIAVLGDSAGAHLAAMLALTNTNSRNSRISAAVVYYGVYDVGALVSHDDTARDNPINQLLGEPINIEAACKQASPIHHITSKAPPFLLVHGANDSVVPVDQTKAFAQALQNAGISVQTVYVTGAEHMLLGIPGPVDPALPQIDRTVLNFFHYWLREST